MDIYHGFRQSENEKESTEYSIYLHTDDQFIVLID